MIVSTLFFIGEILPKGEIYILKIKKLCDFGGSQSAKVREKISANHQISIFGFQCAAKKI
jgi:hypothetical protein